MDWDEKRYERHEEIKRAQQHDCARDREGCDKIHPNIDKIVTAPIPFLRPLERNPPEFRNWLLKPKVCLSYYNQHSMRHEHFNLSQVFAQMNTNGKLNTVHAIIAGCLDEDERSLFYSDIQGMK